MTKQDNISKPAFLNCAQKGQIHLDHHKKRAARSLVVLGFYEDQKGYFKAQNPHKNLTQTYFKQPIQKRKKIMIRHIMIQGDLSAETCECFY